ncbi:Zinc finger CCCH domain-containing protein 6 [Linum perenne]
MRGSQKLRRITWASDSNLCQVRLFLSDESPSQVGASPQDHLQAKVSWVSHLTGTASDDVLPPGFELGQPPNQPQIKASDVPLVKWRCPPRFSIDLQWLVVSGEESQDVEPQNQREMRVLEAVYPRPSAIPTNPTFSGEAKDSQYNDHQVPVIPITPIEDEDSSDVPNDSVGSMSAQPQLSVPGLPHQFGSILEKMAGGLVHDVEPDVLGAAVSIISGSTEQGSLIDHDLLIKILSNPKLIEKLVKDSPKQASPFVTSADPRTDSSAQASLTTSQGVPFYPLANNHLGRGIPGPSVQAPPAASYMNIPPPAVAASSSAVAAAPVKDVSYFKNLIQQHGGERQDRYGQQQQRHDQLGFSKPRTKIMKPCAYFNSSRGCRNGANCSFQHDTSSQERMGGVPSEMQNSKRMKMDREISS